MKRRPGGSVDGIGSGQLSRLLALHAPAVFSNGAFPEQSLIRILPGKGDCTQAVSGGVNSLGRVVLVFLRDSKDEIDEMHTPGTLIGKALEPLEKGRGEILVLLSLQ